LKVLLEILAKGSWNGKDQSDPEVRAMFQPDAILNSIWYKQRLQSKQTVDLRLLQRHIAYLTEYCQRSTHAAVIERLKLNERLHQAHQRLIACQSPNYLSSLHGTLGVDPHLV
jgi:hypothetical protein